MKLYERLAGRGKHTEKGKGLDKLVLYSCCRCGGFDFNISKENKTVIVGVKADGERSRREKPIIESKLTCLGCGFKVIKTNIEEVKNGHL